AKGISFGETVEFTTQPATLPNVSYPVVDSIKQTSIYLHAEVTDVGDSDVTFRGFVWSTSDYPISDNNKIIVGSGLGVFEGVIEGLTPNTLYYLRSFATNSSGTFYSNKIYRFTVTNTPLPTLSEPLVENITASSATVAATITDDGGYSILDKGVKYSWPDGSEEISLGSGLGEINISLTDLLPSTSYTVQAYATNENGKAYGPQVSFTTRFNTYEEALAYLDYHAYPLLHIIAVGEGNHSDFGVKSFDIISDLMGNDMVSGYSGYQWFLKNYMYESHLSKNAKTTMDVWKRLYLLVDQVNFVIDNIDLATGPIEEKNSIKAQAYSLRAFAHFYLVQLFSPAYSNNSNAPGIPYITGGGKGSIPPVISFNNEGSASELQQYVDEIVLYNSENVSKNQKSGSAILQRGTVSDVYNQLQIDLDNAITLFQSGVARVNIQHVDLSVAHGLRARVALAMEDWINASENADAAILAAETDGKALYITSNYNSDGFNSVLGSEWMWGTEKTEENATMYASFFAHMDATVLSYAQLGLQKKITLNLYNSFPASDVRKSLFIEPGTGSEPLVDLNQMKFIDQGGFTGDYLYMRLSEMYLIKAEALAHQVDQYANAQSTLYSLVSQRDNSYVQSTNTAEALVDEVLLHRRMELWGEGHGFTDLKRLQKPLNRPIGVGNHDLAICYVANVTANSDSMVWRIPYHSYLDITINGEGNVDVEGQPYVSPLLIADNSTVILQASPVDLFAGWSVDGEPVSVDPIFELNILNTDVVVTADFVVKYELLLASNPNDIGATITGAGSYEEGLPVTIVADDVPGFQFTGWTGTPDDLALLSSTSEATATFTMPPRAVSYVANYTPVDYTFSTLINPEAYGSVTVSPIQDYYHVGDSITVTASPVEDYEFDNWTEGVTPVSVDTVYKFAMPPRDLVLTANFKLSEYNLSVVVAPTASGTVTKDPLKEFYNAGNTVNLTAVPTQGYRFLKWTEAGTTISTSPNYEVVMPSRDVYLTANFEATPQRTLSLIVNPEDAGTVTGAGTFYEGAEVVVTATPNPGYLFVGWKQANVLVSELPDYVFNIPTTNITLTAQFEVELDPVNQTILLAEGWNIFSTYLTLENASMMNIVQPLITENILVKVQDQTGNSIEKVGEQWIDNIGDLDLNQGYKVKVTQDTAITLSGVYEGGGMSWSFVTGWNLGGFTSNLPVNATVAFSDAVNEEALQKAQSQTGAAYEKLPAFGWVNRIGNLKPGEGYRVRVSKDWTTPNALSSIAPEQFENCVFKPVWGGYGYDHHNIFIQSATLNGYTLPAGTQIGVFDGDRCVGVTIVDEKTSFPINLVAVQDDPFTTEIDGFISGNDFEIKLWDNQSRSFVAHIEFYQYGENEMKFKPGGTTVVDLRAATTVTDVNTETFAHGLGQIFPNPTKNSTTISFSLNRTDEVRIRVFNLLGECVSTLVNKKFYRGHHQVEWNPVKEKLPPGIYLIRMEVNNLVQTSKVVFSH
ncbi:MAG TPA: RagB/SusD family nutrient uptake outer membrane protein, partial [Tenuifilaceae bacterium]|nr:RagB/SusD family nutrient uptake outer membrane protein [Tenuifilaceae bacterium]